VSSTVNLDLHAMHDRIMELSSPSRQVRDFLSRLDAQEAELRHLALCSGAMPDDFNVTLVFRVGRSLVAELR
jgi:hypothetical protein